MPAFHVTVRLFASYWTFSDCGLTGPSQVTFSGNVADTAAPETALDELAMVQITVYDVVASAFGGNGPEFLNGPTV